MTDLYAIAAVVGAIFFLANVILLRWVFRVNRMVRLLESIDESLQCLPAVREAREYEARQHAA